MKNESYNLGFVAFNNPRDVESMIVSLKKWQPRGLNRCLLVDNSTDDSARKAIDAATKSAGWGYVAKENAGFGAGVNELVSMSSNCSVMIILNLDISFCSEPPFLRMTQAIVEESFSLVGTSLLNEYEHPVAGRLPPFSVKMLTFDFLAANQENLIVDQSGKKIHDWCGAVHGACFAVKTEDFIRVGGLDEKLFLYAEEFDLQIKLAKSLKRIGFMSSHSIVHHSEGKVNKENGFLNTYNLRYLAMRERKIILFVFFTFRLMRILFKLNLEGKKPWLSVVRFDLPRQDLLNKLSNQIHAN